MTELFASAVIHLLLLPAAISVLVNSQVIVRSSQHSFPGWLCRWAASNMQRSRNHIYASLTALGELWQNCGIQFMAEGMPYQSVGVKGGITYPEAFQAGTVSEQGTSEN